MEQTTATRPTPNQVVGTWHPRSLVMKAGGQEITPFGPEPEGMLVFTPDLHFIELIRDPGLRPFASPNPGEGTDAENRAAMAGNLALYGRYSVDADGAFAGNVVEGSTVPNWIGDVRTTAELTLTVEGDDMIERFLQPGGATVTIHWRRAAS